MLDDCHNRSDDTRGSRPVRHIVQNDWGMVRWRTTSERLTSYKMDDTSEYTQDIECYEEEIELIADSLNAYPTVVTAAVFTYWGFLAVKGLYNSIKSKYDTISAIISEYIL